MILLINSNTKTNIMHIIKHKEKTRMLNFIINTCIWTLALYGLFEIIKNIIYMFTYANYKQDGIYIIIATKNQENKIEGVLRSCLFKIFYGKEEYIQEIIVTDLQSTDNTREIEERIVQNMQGIKIIKWRECKELIDNIENNN